jgi:hypothetical protein
MKQSTATIAGTVVAENDRTSLRVSGSNEMLGLVPDSSKGQAPVALDGKIVLVEGIIPEAGKGQSTGSIRYRSIKEDVK